MSTCPFGNNGNTFQINLEGLTAKQRALQLAALKCRRHKGECRCYVTGEEPPIEVCKREKRLSRSWVKEREPKGPIPQGDCEIRVDRCCPQKI